MKSNPLLLLATLVVVACNANKPVATDAEEDSVSVAVADSTPATPLIEYNPVDALMFGLKGEVASVNLSVFKMETSGDEISEGEMMYETEMTFDQWGHVTKDEWNNEYGYDADGNFYRGNNIYTKVKRDKEGRIVQYRDEAPNADSDGDVTYNFVYDKKGRLQKIGRSGWYGGFEELRTYEGDKLYPSKVSSEECDEGAGCATVQDSYTYRHIDEKGNWTERLCVRNITTEEEGDYDEEAGTVQTSTNISEQILLEKRSIWYYE